jgi:choline transport protein
MMGLLQTQYALVGADGAAHVVDEIDNPGRNAPMAMVLSCMIGGVTALIVCIAFLAATTDPLAVIEALGGGSLVVFEQGIGNRAGVTILSTLYLCECGSCHALHRSFTHTHLFPVSTPTLVTQLFTTPALMITCSRMIQSFSKDDCLPFKRYLSKQNANLETPVWAVLFNTAWLTVFGLLVFASPVAIIAIQSASVVMLQFSYLPAIFLFLVRGRARLQDLGMVRTFTVGKYGSLVNVIALGYIAITSVFFLFPSVYPVADPSLINYAVVVMAVTSLLAAANWYAYARSRFTVPGGLVALQG